MTDAQEAIIDIKNALDEYGSSITLITNQQTGYSPTTGAIVTRVETPLKAIIKSVSSNENLNNAVANYELSIMFYTTETITFKHLINYDGKDYEIVPKGLDKKVLQDTVLLYEVLVNGQSN